MATITTQVLDPWMSPPLTSLGAVDVVQRYNACLEYRSSAGSAPRRTHGTSPSESEASDSVVDAECKTLEEIAKTVVNKYPRAPTMEQRCCLVTLASMQNLEIVRNVVNMIASQITAATAVRQWQRAWIAINSSCEISK